MKVSSAIRPTFRGCAVSTGSSLMSCRIEFCHSEACQRKATATRMQVAAAMSLMARKMRPVGLGNSR